ncbi:hypothetical protein, partial [uncultured Rothia sp.]|uniref:hypothetical protein n=1 Tax=uncultured Rothia sp. TaxID=316088 RepID=UPI00288B98E0
YQLIPAPLSYVFVPLFLCRSVSLRCPAFPARQYDPVQQYNSAQQQPRSLATRKNQGCGAAQYYLTHRTI